MTVGRTNAQAVGTGQTVGDAQAVTTDQPVQIGDDRAVELLTEMVRAPSLCGQEDEVADTLLRFMEEAGFEACRDDVGNVVGTIRPRQEPDTGELDTRSAVILGHMDTVPGAIPVEQHGGALYGRGTVDAKGPLATATIAAARAAERAHLAVTVIGAVQEEGPSVGARHLTRLPAPDHLIIAEPSGWDSVVLGYKGSQRFTVRFSRPSSHTAGPGTRAPEEAVAFWNDLVLWCRNDDLPGTPHGESFNRLTATLIGMWSESDGLTDTASLQIGLRLPPGRTPEEVQAGVRSLDTNAEYDFSPGEPAVLAPKNTPLVAGFLRSIRAEGGKPVFKVKTGTSDMNVVGPVWDCPMVAYGPGDSRLDHTPHEHVQIDEYLTAIRILTHVLEEL